MKLPDSARFSTICIHAGQEPDPSTGAIITPIFQTSTYVQEELGRHKGYEYARTQNPTRFALEQNLAAIEGGRAAYAFASGMAAINAITTLLQSGDHVVVTDNTYGGTFRLFDKVLRKYGLEFSYVDTSRPELIEQAIRPQTKMLFVETPTNPVLRLTDLARVAEISRSRDIRLVVDNTFASPCLQRPIEFGADLVMHSTTKYLNGHSDSVGGIVIAARQEDADWLKFIQNAAGAILSPFDSWLVLRGTKTLAVRMAQHNLNGQALAEYLEKHPRVKRVIYPGLPSHPGHERIKAMANAGYGFGGMLAIDCQTTARAEQLLSVLQNKERFGLIAVSLGYFDTLMSCSSSSTSSEIPQDEQDRIGLSPGLLRLSIGYTGSLESRLTQIERAVREVSLV